MLSSPYSIVIFYTRNLLLFSPVYPQLFDQLGNALLNLAALFPLQLIFFLPDNNLKYFQLVFEVVITQIYDSCNASIAT